MNNIVGQVVVVLTGIIGIAIVAVLVSKNAQTPAVIASAWKGFSDSIKAATGPVSGGSGVSFGNLSVPNI